MIIAFFVFTLSYSLVSAENEEPALHDSIITGQTLRIGVAEALRSLDFQKAFDPGSILFTHAAGETLYRTFFNQRDSIPHLALDKPTKISESVYEIALAGNIFFNDGTALTSSDVVYTFNRLQDEKNNFPTGFLFRQLSPIIPLAENKLAISFAGSELELMRLLSRPETAIVSEKKVRLLGPSYGTAGILGSGPFMMKDWQNREKIILEKNDRYWKRKGEIVDQSAEANDSEMQEEQDLTRTDRPLIPYSGKIIITDFKSSESLTDKFIQGWVHVALGLDPRLYPDLRKRSARLQLVKSSGERLYQLYVNKMKPLDEPPLRYILSWLINRKDIVDTLFHGQAEVSSTILLPQIARKYNIPDSQFYQFQPQRAAKALGQLGFSKENPLQITVIYSQRPDLEELVKILERQWAQYNIMCKTVPLQKSVIINTLYGRPGGVDFEWNIALEDWRDWRKLDDAPSFLALQFQSDSPFNKTGYIDERADAFFRKGPREQNRAALLPIIERISQECTTIPLACPFQINGYHSNLRNCSWGSDLVPFLEEAWMAE